jgi:hypothetical protein
MVSEEKCIEALQKAHNKLGGNSPTVAEYQSLDISPSYSSIYKTFGGWNEAKKAAGLDLYEHRPNFPDGVANELIECPDILSFDEDEWRDMPKSTRRYYRKQSKLSKFKLSLDGCENCGYDKHPRALQFHHIDPDNKTMGVSRMIQNSFSWDEILNEIDKCELLCANCHAIETNEIPYDI